MTAERLASLPARHFMGTLAAHLGVAVVLGAGTGLPAFGTSRNGLIGSQSPVANDNVRNQVTFGGDAMLVMVTGRIENLFTPTNLACQRRLEAQLRASDKFASGIGPVDTLEFVADQLKVGQAIFADAIAQDNARGDHTAVPASPSREPAGVT